MPIYTLSPNADLSVTFPTGSTDTAPVWSKVNDSNNATGVLMGNNGNITLGFTTFTLPATEYVRQIQIIITTQAPSPFNFNPGIPAAVYAQLHSSSQNLRDFGLLQTTIYDGNYRDYAIAIDGGTPHGPMSQADIDGFEVQFWNPYYNGSNYNFLRVTEVKLVVFTSTFPTLSALGPTGTVAKLAAPISFTLNDVDGPNLHLYRAKIFTNAVVTGPGFNPDTSVSVWDSLYVQTTAPSGSSISFNSPALPNQGSYWLYIIIYESTGFTPGLGPEWYNNGLWYTAQFSTAAPVPFAPSVGVVGDGTDPLGPKVSLTVKSQNNRMPATAFYGEVGSAVAQVNGTLTTGITSPVPPYGTYSYRFNSGGGNGTLRFAYTSSYFHSCVVAPGTQYAFQCFVRAVGAPVASIQLAITWFTSIGGFISTSTSVVFTNESNSVWTLMGFAANAPATAQYAVCDVIFNGTTVGQNHLAANPSLRANVGSGSLIDSSLPYPGAGFYGNAFDAGASTGLDVGPSGVKPEIAGDMVGVNLVGSSSDKANRGSTSWKYTRGVTGQFWMKWPGAAENGKAFYVRPSTKFVYYGALSVSLGAGVATQTMYAAIQFWDANFQLVRTVVSASASVTNAAWTRFTVTGAVPTTDSVYATLTLSCTSSGTVSDPFYVDDLVFKQDDGVNAFSIGNSSIVPGTSAYQTDTEMYVERSTDGGKTWNPVRSTYAQPGTGVDQVFTGNDYEVMGGQTVSYRAYVISYQTNQALQSAYSTPVTIVVPNTTDPVLARRWWFRDPYDPTDNMPFDILEGGLQINYPEDQALFNPIGRNRKVVVAGAVKGAEFSLTLDFLSDTEYNSFMALRGKQRVLLMQRSWSLEQWYVKLGNSVTVDEENTTPVRRSVKLEAVEVDVPAVL
jgi:hypothetical protein